MIKTLNDNKLFSIGLPVVKDVFLKEAIKSCLKQTYTNFELVLVNNAKTGDFKDRIRDIYNSFNDDRIKYHENEAQLAMIDNWNLTLKLSSGDLFSILCDDDLWESNYIEEMVKLSQQNLNCNLFHCRVKIIYEGSDRAILSSLCSEFENSFDFIYHRIMGYRKMYLSDFTVRVNALNKIGGFFAMPDGWGSDDLTWFKLSLEGGVAYTSKILFIYRNHKNNISNTVNIKNKWSSIPKYADFIKKYMVGKDLNKKDEILQKLILDELPNYKKRGFASLYHKKIMSYKYLPSSLKKIISKISRLIIFTIK
jgi:glycosyltransferase involved in cell wall biosynthesis